ncbi:MAG: F0F1 ATP synthase subunit delta [Rhodobacteraceae bacterium]|nr:F0F1 ATP synthase subunit delta [Paracoccaceae bacterium]
MSEPASISLGIAVRYATAIFEIVKANKNLPKLDESVVALSNALSESEDLRTLISSPLVARDDQKSAIMAISRKMNLIPTLHKGLGLMAERRRLFVLPQLLDALLQMLAEERNEVTADVASAKALTQAQLDKLTKTLSERVGKTVTINATVDEMLIGGLVVKVGSKMIDTSISSKLAFLQKAMKEVG